MNEEGTLDRREAVAGLGLMAGLTVALLGVIVYRIVDGAPARNRHIAPAVIAAQESIRFEPAWDTEPAAAGAPLAATPSLPMSPKKLAGGSVEAPSTAGDGVQSASHEVGESADPTTEQSSLKSAPRFIAPAGRSRQTPSAVAIP